MTAILVVLGLPSLAAAIALAVVHRAKTAPALKWLASVPALVSLAIVAGIVQLAGLLLAALAVFLLLFAALFQGVAELREKGTSKVGKALEGASWFLFTAAGKLFPLWDTLLTHTEPVGKVFFAPIIWLIKKI